MMEENNRKGPGVFYAVMGVATLVVAIIGATFAYFSASATTNYQNQIQGGTYDELSNAFTLTVTRVDEAVVTATSDKLVPTDINGASSSSVENAVAKNCESNGYTGCHLYKIVATTTQNVANASILLDSLTVTAKGASVVESDWEYSFFTANDDKGTSAAVVEGANGNFEVFNDTYVGEGKLGLDVHKNAQLTTAGQTYYLLIFLKNDADNAQNAGDAQDATGTYKGTVSLTAGAAGGKVTASFGV